MNVKLIQFFYINEKDFSFELIRNLLKNAIFIDIHQMIGSFQFFDNFNELNPYYNLSLPSKPNEILDLYYKRIIIISSLLSKAFILLKDLNFFELIFKEIAAKFQENSSNLLILYCSYSEIIKSDKSFLKKLKECSIESLESVLNLESYDLQRCDIKDIEAQIFNNLHTLKILMMNSSNSEYITFMNDISKIPNQEKRKKLEEIYNKVLNYYF